MTGMPVAKGVRMRRWSPRVILALAATATTAAFAGPPAHPLPGDAWRDPLTSITFRYCPPGTFVMGTPEEESYQVPDQKPRHAVTLTRGFWLAPPAGEYPCGAAIPLRGRPRPYGP